MPCKFHVYKINCEPVISVMFKRPTVEVEFVVSVSVESAKVE